MKFKHFIITRFNINIAFPVKNPSDSPIIKRLDEDYLEERFNLFEKYTLPSIMKQTNQNFKWIILFHKQTPDKFLKRIKVLKKVYEFDDLYFDNDEHFNFSEYCDNNNILSDFYITTRLDNDDIIDKNYVYKVQEYANSNLHECFISFPKGAKLDLNFNKRIETDYKFNHFTSFIGTKEKTIFDFNHTIIDKSDKDIVYLETETPMWTEIIHKSNVINEITAYEVARHHSIHGTDKKDDLAIYQLINLKNKLNKEKKNYINDYVSIDDYTYGKPIIQKYSGVKLKIGKFCCIENNVTFLLGGEHRTDWITTYPFNILVGEFGYIKGHPNIKGDINVGNDVWIGHGSKILSGVNIGDGAVIISNSLITEDVPDYAIVAGNPATVVDYRFDRESISKLKEIKWWNFKEDKLVKIIPFIQNDDIENFFKVIDSLDDNI